MVKISTYAIIIKYRVTLHVIKLYICITLLKVNFHYLNYYDKLHEEYRRPKMKDIGLSKILIEI